MDISLSLIMDVIVLAALAVTIYYAVRLSRSLSVFRQYRHEFSNVLAQLSKNIDQANAAILGMKEASRSSGEHLQELIDQARLLTDELNLINQAGDSLAGRLENLAEKNRKIVKGQDIANDSPDYEKKPRNGHKNGSTKAARADSITDEEKAFFIQDRDFGDDLMDEAGIPEELQSQAERELYMALNKKH
ncbi:MAG: DUF6468 domain-containing protein [Alphaproteobacteria bacterium]|nr:DUF6468 domain-containing protein [Alphaproteobacteria bacterium]